MTVAAGGSTAGGKAPRRTRAVWLAGIGLWVRTALRIPPLVAVLIAIMSPSGHPSSNADGWWLMLEVDAWVCGLASFADGAQGTGRPFMIGSLVGGYAAFTALYGVLGVRVLRGVKGTRLLVNVLMGAGLVALFAGAYAGRTVAGDLAVLWASVLLIPTAGVAVLINTGRARP